MSSFENLAFAFVILCLTHDLVNTLVIIFMPLSKRKIAIHPYEIVNVQN